MSVKTPVKESKDRRGAGGVFLHSLGNQVPCKNLLSRLAAGAEVSSFLPPSLCRALKVASGFWASATPRVLG